VPQRRHLLRGILSKALRRTACGRMILRIPRAPGMCSIGVGAE
jgi:hypothetical protein